MRRALVLLLLLGCAPAKRRPRDTPQFRDCRDRCLKSGFAGAAVLEDEDSFQCFCKSKPEAT